MQTAMIWAQLYELKAEMRWTPWEICYSVYS